MLFRNAARFATPTVEVLARDAGYSRVMFDTYLNRSAPSRAAAMALANALDERAIRLVGYADQLRTAAGEDAGDVSA